MDKRTPVTEAGITYWDYSKNMVIPDDKYVVVEYNWMYIPEEKSKNTTLTIGVSRIIMARTDDYFSLLLKLVNYWNAATVNWKYWV